MRPKGESVPPPGASSPSRTIGTIVLPSLWYVSLPLASKKTSPFGVIDGLVADPKLGPAGSGLTPSATAEVVLPSLTNTPVVKFGAPTLASKATSWRAFKLRLLKENGR